MQVTLSAYSAVQYLGLDRHSHPRSNILPLGNAICNEGLSKESFEILHTVDSYTPKSSTDVSYALFRIWNAVKSLFGQSLWQKTVPLHPGDIKSRAYAWKEMGLQRILEANLKAGDDIVSISKPLLCPRNS